MEQTSRLKRYERRVLKRVEKDKKKDNEIYQKKLDEVIRVFVKAREYKLCKIGIDYRDFKYLNRYVKSLNELYPDLNFVWWEVNGDFGNLALYTKPYIQWNNKNDKKRETQVENMYSQIVGNKKVFKKIY